jgi:hypothetical protein
MTSNNTKEGILTYREEKAPREALPWAASQRQAKMMNQALQPRRAPRERPGDRDVKPFNENALAAISRDATDATGVNLDQNQFSLRRQI